MTLEQYNTLLAAAPLIESVLAEKNEKTVRPNYDGEVAGAETTEEGTKESEAAPDEKNAKEDDGDD